LFSILPPFFIFPRYGGPRDLHSFPTRRSSDLHLQPLAFHVNGSIRGKLAVEEADVQWVLERMAHYRQELGPREHAFVLPRGTAPDRKSTRLNSSHVKISYAVFCLKKKKKI